MQKKQVPEKKQKSCYVCVHAPFRECCSSYFLYMSACCCAQRSSAAVYVVMCPLAALCVLMLLYEEGSRGRERERERCTTSFRNQRVRKFRAAKITRSTFVLEQRQLWRLLAPQTRASAGCISESVFASRTINRNINVSQ
jgi:hypothetical protein